MKIRRSTDRGHVKRGWLDTYHTFSFSDYYDPAWMGYRSLRVINDDRIAAGMGFGTHPHRDMEIITYVLSGALEHKDSMGNGRIIRAGELQYMAAGTGIQHSEFNPSSHEPTHLLQIWIQPAQLGARPNYAEKSLMDEPTGGFSLMTSQSGRDGSIAINQDADLWLAKLDPGQAVEHSLSDDRHACIHLAEGEITINGETLRAGDAAVIDEPISLKLTASETSQVLLFDLN